MGTRTCLLIAASLGAASCADRVAEQPDRQPALAALPPESMVPPPVAGPRIDFEMQVRPIVDPRCGPCHFEGGKMYEELPFDDPATFARLGEALFTRIDDETERATIRAYLEQLDGQDPR